MYQTVFDCVCVVGLCLTNCVSFRSVSDSIRASCWGDVCESLSGLGISSGVFQCVQERQTLVSSLPLSKCVCVKVCLYQEYWSAGWLCVRLCFSV